MTSADLIAELRARIETLEAEIRQLRSTIALQSVATTEEPALDRVDVITDFDDPTTAKDPDQVSAHRTPAEKIALFRSRFRGRDAMYALRWENREGSRHGYSPACSNEWKPGVCEKPRIKCQDCRHRGFKPVDEHVIRDHLTGAHIVGLYALDANSHCHFVVADFDHDHWQDDIQAFARTCQRAQLPVLLEISRSGDGAHAWLFFDAPVPAEQARRLATGLIERTSREERLVSLSSYDRLIPNQDTLSGAGFGSLIALPLQKSARARGASVFVDETLQPIDDQWAALAACPSITASALPATIAHVTAGNEAILTSSLGDPDRADAPWRKQDIEPTALADLPEKLAITLADGVYIDRSTLPQPLVHALARTAVFANPLWYELNRVHRSTWNTPRFIDKAQSHPSHIRVPRGCMDDVNVICERYQISAVIRDERHRGQPLAVTLNAELRDEQRDAVAALIFHDTGVLNAPPGFGKTVVAAAVIAQRQCTTLILVNTTALLKQWCSSLSRFLNRPLGQIGTVGGGRKSSLTGELDVASIQTLSRQAEHELHTLLSAYGQVVVDECHHVGAASYAHVLDQVHSRYVLGLSATPERRDGLEPLVYMHCGPVRHHVRKVEADPLAMSVHALRWDHAQERTADTPVQTLLSIVAEDVERTHLIVEAGVTAWRAGRKVLILTDRRAHIEAIVEALGTMNNAPTPFVLHGQLARRDRQAVMAQLDLLNSSEPRCLVATGRLVGEGFDHPALDTVVFAMPFAWRGTLKQYVGRLARPAPGKSDAQVIDVCDHGHPILESMWRKRAQGYRALGWHLQETPQLF